MRKNSSFLNSSLINVLGEHNCKGKYIANAKYLKYFKTFDNLRLKVLFDLTPVAFFCLTGLLSSWYTLVTLDCIMSHNSVHLSLTKCKNAPDLWRAGDASLPGSENMKYVAKHKAFG